MSSASVAIMAMGAYSVRNRLEINTMADSPGRPMTENAGDRKLAM